MRLRFLTFLSVPMILFAQGQRQVGELIMENVPEIPRAVLERSAQYRNVRTASFRSWHPGGESMLIGTRFGETTQLHLITEPMGVRSQITFYDEPARGGYFCPDDTQNGFLFSKDIGGNEYYQIFYFDLTTGTARMLTDGKSRNSIGAWSKNGRQFAFTSNMGNGTDMQIYLGDIKGNYQPLVQEKGYWYAVDWSPDDGLVLVGRYVSINESYLYIVDVKTGKMNPFNPNEEKVSYGVAAFSMDGKGIYYTSDENSEFRHLRYYDFNTGEHEILTRHIPWDVSGFTVANDGKYIAYIINKDGIGKLYLVKTKGFRAVSIPKLPLGRINGVKFHPDNKKLSMTLNTSHTPGDVFVLDIRKNRLTRWTQSEVGGLDTKKFIEPELIHVKSFDGLTVPGFIYKPQKQGPHPVVVYIHGGPESQYRPGFSSTFQYWVNELGVAVLATNVRGSAGYGKSYVKMDNGFKREDSVKDISAFLDWIETQPDLDSDRVAVYGGSYGGYMVLASMTHYNDRLSCAVDNVGISNFVTFLKNTKSYRRDLRRAEYGDERDEAMNAYLEKISPNNNAHKITKPLFIVQGYNDPRVPVTEAEQMRDEIRRNGGQVWYMVAMDEGHGFRKKFNRDYYINAVSLFWETFLLK